MYSRRIANKKQRKPQKCRHIPNKGFNQSLKHSYNLSSKNPTPINKQRNILSTTINYKNKIRPVFSIKTCQFHRQSIYLSDDELGDDLLATPPSKSFLRDQSEIILKAQSPNLNIDKLNQLSSQEIAKEIGLDESVLTYLQDDEDDTNDTIQNAMDVSEDEESNFLIKKSSSTLHFDSSVDDTKFQLSRIPGRHTVNLLPKVTPRDINHRGRITIMRQLPNILLQKYQQIHPNLRSIVKALLDSQKLRHFDIAVTLSSATKVQNMNRQFCFDDQPTDTLVFPMEEPYAPGIPVELGNIADLGEIVLSVPYILAKARHHHHVLQNYNINFVTNDNNVLNNSIETFKALSECDPVKYLQMINYCQLSTLFDNDDFINTHYHKKHERQKNSLAKIIDSIGINNEFYVHQLLSLSNSSVPEPSLSQSHNTTSSLQYLEQNGKVNPNSSLYPLTYDILEDEINIVLTHGFLHLCGYKHDTPQSTQAMYQETHRILQQLYEKEIISLRCLLLSKLYVLESTNDDDNIINSQTATNKHDSFLTSGDEHMNDIIQNYNIALPAGLFSDNETTIHTASDQQIEQLISKFDKQNKLSKSVSKLPKTTQHKHHNKKPSSPYKK